MLNDTTYYVYVLRDPRDNSPKYVGVSCDPERRLHDVHLRSPLQSIRKWILDLKKLGLIPTLEILDSVFGSQMAGRYLEQKYIHEFSYEYSSLLNQRHNASFHRRRQRRFERHAASSENRNDKRLIRVHARDLLCGRFPRFQRGGRYSKT